jgi:hypothetical protein
LIHPAANARGTQVMLLQDYSGTIGPNSLTIAGTDMPITLQHPPNCYGPVNNAIWYFMLGPKQTAQLTNYAANPAHFALWVPVDSSLDGQNPSTCWFSNSCFSYPFTAGSPSTAVPAGATFVEFNVRNNSFDTVDISEVNGVNAAWRVGFPTGWTNSAYLSQSAQLIPVGEIKNDPGASPNFYGDYGNPGVYPFGCTNCASRYNNTSVPNHPPGTQKSGCLQADFNAPVTYPTQDVGCDNAINYYPTNANTMPPPAKPKHPLDGYENPPPGVQSLPATRFYTRNTLFDLKQQNPIPFVGYGICELQRGANPAGGNFNIYLEQYPFGQIQGQPALR